MIRYQSTCIFNQSGHRPAPGVRRATRECRAAARGTRPRAARGRHRARRPRARARRGRHGQDPRDHAPDRVCRRDRHVRPQRRPRGYLHDARRRRAPGQAGQARRGRHAGPHVPLRRPASGPVLLAAGLRLRAPEPDLLEARPARRSGRAAATQGFAGRPPRPGRRGRVGQGLQRPPRRLRPPRAGSRPRRRGIRRGHGGGRLCGIRRGQALPPAHRHGGRPALCGGGAERRRAGVGDGAASVPVVRRRRVPGRQPDPVSAARPVAWRPRRPLRGRRPGPDDLLVRRRFGRLPASVPDEVSAAPPRSL